MHESTISKTTLAPTCTTYIFVALDESVSLPQLDVLVEGLLQGPNRVRPPLAEHTHLLVERALHHLVRHRLEDCPRKKHSELNEVGARYLQGGMSSVRLGISHW